MKKLNITLVLILITLISCNQKSNNTQEKNVHEINKKTTASTKPDKNFKGNWVNKKYVDELIKTKSPKTSQDITPMSMIIIPENFNKKATIIWGFHEGDSKIIDDNNGQVKIRFAENKESELILIDEKNLKIDNKQFIKLKESENQVNYNIVEELIFAGKYDLNGQEVEFTYDGKVKGLKDIEYYMVFIDYQDVGMQVNQLLLGTDFNNSESYGFEFNQDQLIIYQLNCVTMEQEECIIVENGEEKFKLTKK